MGDRYGYYADLAKMTDDYHTGINDYFNSNAKLLGKESGDNGGDSHPQNAIDAADHFSRAAAELLSIHAAMVVEMVVYKENWTGPAADVFYDALSTITAYFFASAQNLDPDYAKKFGWAGAAMKVGDNHRAAIGEHNTHFDLADTRFWDLLGYANAEELGVLAQRLDNLDDNYWYDRIYSSIEDYTGELVFNQQRYDDELEHFRERREYYSDEFSKIWPNYIDPITTTMNNLSIIYTDTIPMLMPPAALPQFQDNYDDYKGDVPNPYDPYNPQDSDGDGVPDIQDPYPDDPTKKGPQPPEPEKDSDGDGVPDYADPYPYDPDKFGPQPPDLPDDPLTPHGGDVPGGGLPGGGLPDGGLPDGGLSPGLLAPGALAPLPVPEPPAPGKLVVGPDGTPGYDLTGNGIPDIGLDGRPLPNGDLPNAELIPGSNGRGGGVDVTNDGVPDVNLNGRVLPGGPAPGAQLAKGPNGLGYDVTGNGKPDLDLDGNVLPDGDLPPGTRVVTGPNGVRGLDLNGDGIPDVDFGGHALPGGAAPPGSQLSTGPDGTTGFDITHNRHPDIDSNGNPLPDGDLPPGTRVVTGPDGVRGLDLNGDGIPDVDFGGHALPGGTGPAGSNLVTTPDGTTGFDINGDGIPDLDLRGNPLPGIDHGSVSVPELRAGDQVTMGPGFPGQPVAGGAGGGLVATAPPGPAPSIIGGDALTAGRGMGAPMMPPMIPPMLGGQQKNERETWLQEEDDVWTGDDARLPVATLGRPGGGEKDEDLPDSAWEEEAPVKAPAPRGGPRPTRPPAGAPQRGSRR